MKGITKVFDNPTLFETDYESEVYVPKLKSFPLEVLALVSWHMNENLGWMIRNEILNQSLRFNLEIQINIQLICNNKQISQEFFKNSHRYHPRKIFGNTLKSILRTFKVIGFKRKNKTSIPEPPRIGVGYKDKGSLPKSDHKTENDYELELRSLEQIQKKKSMNDTLLFLEGLLGGG